ncbi:Bax inhibitor-1/YccA family protein [Solimonas marina]|uniref:Bax inhibitor-1/YccA family protein n=1 Tax=Solimonas marina TaxID=2714601 RepID=A0A969W642_9GAMM|nr:Bax inhibitor-1/YccA family protein [Solimonas marina]NKF21117.1 Bax inhibitor-1/YccA family protein [Solimonas marina]
MRSNNPVLRDKTFEGGVVEGERMTMNGMIGKTGILFVLLLIAAGWTWTRFNDVLAASGPQAAMSAVSPFIWGGLLVGFGLAMVTVFKANWSGITAPLYAMAEGFALGGISAFFELRFQGIVLQAVGLTIGVLAVMLFLYRSRIIQVTDKFRMGVVAATGGIALLYLVDMGLRAFTSIDIPFIHEGGAMGIGFSLLVVGLAALNLTLDFDAIERGVAAGAPKVMEWYGAFSLMVTLVWLYLELLRLLAKARR